MMMVNGIRIMVSPQHSIEQLVQSPVKPRERSICHILWLRVTRLSDQESILPPSSHVTWRGSKSIPSPSSHVTWRGSVLLPGAGEAPELALQRAPAWVLPALPGRLEKPLLVTVPHIITTSAGGGDVTAMCRRVSTCGRRLTRSSATLVTLSHLHTSHRSQLDPS